MGYWCTLHLFDDQKFYGEVVPKFRGEIGDLKDDYIEFLKNYITGGISNLSEEGITVLIEKRIECNKNISNSFDELFKTHQKFDQINEYNAQFAFLRELEGYEEFCSFFEYFIFKYCSDFYPQILLGKGGVMRNFELNNNSISYSIISELDNWNIFFCYYTMGITNWLTSEEVELLYLDRENLIFNDSLTAEGFLNLLEVAYQNKLGFIIGVDMRQYALERLPKNKLVNAEIWDNVNIKGVCFDIHKELRN